MMKIRLTHYERIAGLFVLFAIVGCLVTAVSVAVKQGWFEDKVYFQTYFENADGLHEGTVVQMAGLRAGSVSDVQLESDNKIKVIFYVLGKFRGKVKKDSTAQLIRPFLIGDRMLDISVGSPHETVLAEKSNVQSQEATDVMSLLSGKKLGIYMSQTAQMLENLKTVMEAFLSKNRTENMVKIFDKLAPLIENMNTMSVEVTKLSKQATDQNNMKNTLNNVAILTAELNKTLPHLTEAMKEIGPEMPKTAKRAVEALEEATILIKAMQKSLFMRSNVEEVRAQERSRLPAAKLKEIVPAALAPNPPPEK
jgi:phospholipid/cholesterol/gamma-HCH transport system substrate-binding protein